MKLKLDCSFPLNFFVISDIHWSKEMKSHEKKFVKTGLLLLKGLLFKEGTNFLLILGDLGEPTLELLCILKKLADSFDFILFLSGNHDIFLPPTFSNLLKVDHTILEINDGIKIIDIEKIEDRELLCQEAKRAGILLLISHRPPYGILDLGTIEVFSLERGQQHCGDKNLLSKLKFLRQYVPKISYVLFGHVHNQGGRIKKDKWYKYVNVSPFRKHLWVRGATVFILRIFKNKEVEEKWKIPFWSLMRKSLKWRRLTYISKPGFYIE